MACHLEYIYHHVSCCTYLTTVVLLRAELQLQIASDHRKGSNSFWAKLITIEAKQNCFLKIFTVIKAYCHDCILIYLFSTCLFFCIYFRKLLLSFDVPGSWDEFWPLIEVNLKILAPSCQMGISGSCRDLILSYDCKSGKTDQLETNKLKQKHRVSIKMGVFRCRRR